MHILSVPQPWATLLSRGVARFVVREDTTDYRGTIAIHASESSDAEALERFQADAEFAERMGREGFASLDSIEALPRNAIVGVAVIADLWSLKALEEIVTEDDALLLGDVAETAVFWELAEALEIAVIDDPAPAANEATVLDSADGSGEDAEAASGDHAGETTASLAPLSEEQTHVVQDAARAAGAHFDDQGLVFWPMTPSASLAVLIGDDAIGDREITRRVWEYVTEQDLQDPEDHAYVFLDDALRAALDVDIDGMPTVEFSERIVLHMRR